MKDNEFNAWEVKRTKGKLNFVLVTGVLSYGLPMFILMAFMQKPFVDGLMTQAAMIHYLVWLLAGLFFGTMMWSITQWRYKKELARRHIDN